MTDLKELFATEFGHSESDSMKLQGLGEIPHPANCFICGTGNCEAGYLNTGIWHDFVGNLLICVPDLIKMAEKVGCLAPSVNELLTQSNKDLVKANAELTEQNEKLNGKIRSYRDILTSDAGSDVGSTYESYSVPDSPIDEKPKTVDSVLEGTITDSDGQSTVVTESDESTGSSDSKQSSTFDITETRIGPEL